MTVIKYDELHQHGGGFQGYRVARTIGTDSEYRQQYYSFSIYGEKTAKSLAYALDSQWQKEAARMIHAKHLLTVCQLSEGKNPNIIVKGLRAYINIEKKVRKGELKTYFSPVFLVKIPGFRKSDICFRIRKHGYQNAYIKAAKRYAEIHNLSAAASLALIAKQPDQTLFTEYMLPLLRKSGYKLTKKALLEALNP